MTGNDDHRIVSREDPDGTRHTASVRRTPETDRLSDDQIITSLQEWKAQHHKPQRERWPMPNPFHTWLMATKPGPREPCPECRTWGLRLGASPDNPGDEKVICTHRRCIASPFYRGDEASP